MRQRLALAQTMLGMPDLLVLDEPANGLDPAQIRALRTILRDYATSGRTVLLSSHALTEVEKICDEILVPNRRRLVLAGTVEEMPRARPAVAMRRQLARPSIRVCLAAIALLPASCVFGEAISRESHWSYLPVLLTVPIPRGRLMHQKALACPDQGTAQHPTRL